MTEQEKIDHDIKNRIIEVFDQYNATDADSGWALLREKYPVQQKKQEALWPWYAAAALILLFLGVWFIKKPQAPVNKIAKNPKGAINHFQKIDKLIKPVAPANILQQQQVAKTPATERDNKHQPHTLPEKQQNPANANQLPAADAQIAKQWPQHKHEVINQPAVSGQLTQQVAVVTGQPQPQNNTAVEPSAKQPEPAVQQPKEALIPQATAVNPIANAGNKSANSSANTLAKADEKPSARMNKLLNEKYPEPKTANQSKAALAKAALSVYAGTYVSYAQGSDNNLNVAAGISSDFRISKKLKISAGLAIAQNKLSYNNSTTGNANTLTATVPAAANDRIFGSTAPTADFGQTYVVSNAFAASKVISATSIPVLTKYNASLVGLDVPVSIKYEFNPDKNYTYVTAGVSSGTFINETYTTNFSSLQKTQENTQKGSFNGFNVAKTLDMSFGWGYPVGKSNVFIIEPFLKYPINAVGLQQVRYGTSGVNLKFSFKR